jgi:Fe-S-cluster containining protein
MTYGDLVSHVKFDMERDSPFSYACHACNRCCCNKAIRVSPYEILRLARYLCIPTTQFIENHTEAGGTVLRSTENGDCGFLGERGCSVHPDRPLACRIYPLARWVSPDGEESFGHLTPHPKTKGVYGISGTVQDYLDHQQLAPFFEMSEACREEHARVSEGISERHHRRRRAISIHYRSAELERGLPALDGSNPRKGRQGVGIHQSRYQLGRQELAHIRASDGELCTGRQDAARHHL